MTTATWSSRLRHDSNATYQEWRDEFITKLGVMVTAGKLAADETNITPGAGAIPGINTEGGYAVYHISDSLHGTAPIYIRFGFGTGAGTTTPRLQWTIGTSTNGSGVIGGTCLSPINSMTNGGGAAVAETTDTARSSYLCVTAGFFGLQWKIHTANNFDSANFIARTVDNTGAISAIGAMYYVNANTNNSNTTGKIRPVRFASTAAIYGSNTSQNLPNIAISVLPLCGETGTLVGSDIQACLCWVFTPTVLPLLGGCGVLDSEVNQGVTFTATLVGSTPHTYIGLGTIGTSICGIAPAANIPKLAMLWE